MSNLTKYLVSALIFVLIAAGCANGNESAQEEPLEFRQDYEAVFYYEPEVLLTTHEKLVGTWVLESQETPLTLAETIILLNYGVKLFIRYDNFTNSLFWEVNEDVLTTFVNPDFKIEFDFQIVNENTLVFTYDDGLTGTYVRSADPFPFHTVASELLGEWSLIIDEFDEDVPVFIYFSYDGSGVALFEVLETQYFVWSSIMENVLIIDFGEGEEPYLITLSSVHADYNNMMVVSSRNGVVLLYRLVYGKLEEVEYEVPDFLEEEFSDPHFQARWRYEQFFLPVIIFGMESEILEKLHNADTNALREHIMPWWEIAAGTVVLTVWDDMGFEIPDTEEERLALANMLRPEVSLGDEHIADVQFVQIDSYTKAFVIEMLDINQPRVSTFIGIAHNEEMGLSIFTLEKLGGFIVEAPEAHIFCFLAIDSRGSFHSIDNTIEAFVNAMHEAMNGLIVPSMSVQRDLTQF